MRTLVATLLLAEVPVAATAQPARPETSPPPAFLLAYRADPSFSDRLLELDDANLRARVYPLEKK